MMGLQMSLEAWKWDSDDDLKTKICYCHAIVDS